VGVREVLLVGGEPTIAPALLPIVNFLKSIPQIKKICMTTNGDRLLTSKGNITQFAKTFCTSTSVTHINLSLMSLDADMQRKIGGSQNSFDISGLSELYSLCQNAKIQLRINCNVFRGNNDTLDSLLKFYHAVAPNCDSVKFSPLLRVDNFSVVNRVLTFVAENILSDTEYEALFKSVEESFREQPIIRNPLTFGFVENSMIMMDTPIILNYNHRGQMATYAAMGRVNNVKLLTNGNLSLSWNKDDESRVIRFGKLIQ
jgi:molybdenum cofactor biosynthesis enzyme MoaA